MQYTHTTKYLRISPKKLTLVAKAIKGMKPAKAIEFLSIQPQKGANLIQKGITAARNNAEQAGIKLDELVISSVSAQRGPTFMRRWIKPKGRSTPKRKPTTHAVILFVDQTTEMKKAALKAAPVKAEKVAETVKE